MQAANRELVMRVAELEAAFTDEKEAIVSQAEKTQATLEEERRAAEVAIKKNEAERRDAVERAKAELAAAEKAARERSEKLTKKLRAEHKVRAC